MSRIGLLLCVLCCCALTDNALAEEQFFPAGILNEHDDGSGGTAGGHLFRMKEPSLFKQGSGTNAAVWRFILDRDTEPFLVFRITFSKKDRVSLLLRASPFVSADGTFELQPVQVLQERDLLPSEIDVFMRLVEMSDFWRQQNTKRGWEQQSTRGSNWILECAQGKKYHITKRWLPLFFYGPWMKDVGPPAATEAEEEKRAALSVPKKSATDIGLDLLCLYITALGKPGIYANGLFY